MRITREIEAEVRGPSIFKRMGIISYKALKVGDPLILVREPANRFDKNAIVVHNVVAEPVGYVAREVAAEVAPEIDQGIRWNAKVIKEWTRKKEGLVRALLWKEEEDDDAAEGKFVTVQKDAALIS